MAAPSTEAGRGWFDRLIDAFAFIAGVLLCVLTVMICLDVLVRNLRLFPMPWTLDVAEYLLYIITFAGAPWVLREGGHIAIDILVQQLPPAARRRAVDAANVMGAIICGVLFYYFCRVWWRTFSEGILIHETFIFPEWTLFSLGPPTFLILFVIFLRALWRRQPVSGGHNEFDGI